MPVKRILVVDDSPTERHVLLELLTRNGYQATRTLTRDEATRQIPIIVCTSKGQETDKIWGLRQGAIDYLIKPVNAEELLARIAAL